MKIHPAEMFPLILSMSIILQAIVFISVQSSNTTPILFDGCGRIVQLIFPGTRLARALVVYFAANVCSALAAVFNDVDFWS